ncbi:MAG: class I SAM-dependent methyltransferase [Candidatus Hodarchaeales archaeon]
MPYQRRGLVSFAGLLSLFVTLKSISVNGDVLEIGSFMGSSSLVLAAGNALSKSESTVWLVEPNPKPSKKDFLANIKNYGLDRNVTLIDKTSNEARKIIEPSLKFIFIDGNHEYNFVKEDILSWAPLLKKNGMMTFHDFGDGWPGVQRAVEEFLMKSKDFIALGPIADIFYICKGETKNNTFMLRLSRLHRIRKTLKVIAKLTKLELNSKN